MSNAFIYNIYKRHNSRDTVEVSPIDTNQQAFHLARSVKIKQYVLITFHSGTVAILRVGHSLSLSIFYHYVFLVQ